MRYLLAIDQGTTSSRTIIYNEQLEEISKSQKEFTQIYPQAGWVEHNADEIWQTQLFTIHDAITNAGIELKEIAGIGITNQRETIVLWNKLTGKPVYHAIVWQDKRTIEMCEQLKLSGLENYVQQFTGLRIDAYFSATKIKWILEHIPEAKKLTEEKLLLAGTIDSWLIWKLTQGKIHATDVSNASRTMLYNIRELRWDAFILSALRIPEHILPEVKNSVDHFGAAEFQDCKIPIYGVAGDQQAALFGQKCFQKGAVKNTYGTGCFMLMHIGDNFIQSNSHLLTTIAWGIQNNIEYALEGSVFIGGAVIQWLRDQLKIISTAEETEQIAKSLSDNGGVYFVPAFAGLGAPYWDMYATGIISGLTRGTTDKHIVRAALESIAYQTKDLLMAMNADAGNALTELKVDGGAASNNWLMQFQSDVLQAAVIRAEHIESTALGAASLAGIGAGLFTKEMLQHQNITSDVFLPKASSEKTNTMYSEWKQAVAKAMKKE